MNLKNEKGITLLTLVVTIVVMIILASIVVSSSIGDNGLIIQTENSIIKASIREVEEALDTKLLLKEKEEIKTGNLGNLTIEDLVEDKIVESDESNISKQEVHYNVYKIDISKLDIKGNYGKGTDDTDVFKVEVELTGDSGAETNNYKVFYLNKKGNRIDN